MQTGGNLVQSLNLRERVRLVRERKLALTPRNKNLSKINVRSSLGSGLKRLKFKEVIIGICTLNFRKELRLQLQSSITLSLVVLVVLVVHLLLRERNYVLNERMKGKFM